VLVPRWIDTGFSPEVRAFYDGLEADIAGRGLSEHFVFHDWIGDDEMPEFYGMGHVTLAVGSYVETFGNTPYESLACGTPVIVAKVAAYRGMLPQECLVEYGDVNEVAKRAAAILREKRRTSDDIMNWLHTNFAQQAMVEAYADVILNARKLPPMPYRHRPIDEKTVFRLAPWCYVAKHGIYHDFRGDYTGEPELVDLVLDYPDGFTFANGEPEEILRLYREGYLAVFTEL
jgi:hypothetical protein